MTQEDLNKQNWDKIYSQPWDKLPWSASIKQEFEKQYLDKYITEPNQDILEYGCGTGFVADYLATKGHNVLATEYSKVAVDIIKSQNPPFEIMETSRPADVRNRSFDAITSFAVLHHQNPETQKMFLLDFAKILKPKGQIIITGWDKDDEFWTAATPISTQGRFSINGLEKEVPKLGLKIINSEIFAFKNPLAPFEKDYLFRCYTMCERGAK